MKEREQVKLIEWIELNTVPVDVAELGLKKSPAIADVPKFLDDFLWELERLGYIPKKKI